MNHSDVRNRMAEYLEGDLSLDRRALFDAHLDACPDCASDLEELRTTIHLLRSLPDVEPPPQLAADVMRRIRLGEATPGALERLREFVVDLFSPGIAVPAGAMVAAFAMAVTSGTFELPFAGPQAVSLSQTASADLAPIPREAQVFANQVFAGRAADRQGPAAFRGSDSTPATTRPPVVFQVLPASTGSSQPAAPRVRVVVQPRPEAALEDGTPGTPRTVDDWLAVVVAQPAAFASRQASLSVAEQEHWVRALARGAVERGMQDVVVASLRRSGTPEATSLAEAIAGQARDVSPTTAGAR